MKLFCDLIEYGLGGPDGLTVNQYGYIFLALYGKAQEVLVISPTGKVLGTLPTGPLTSNCVFSGDGKTLYITANKKLLRVVVPDFSNF